MTAATGAERSRILFVDDEQKVVDGLRRMLHVYRDRWDMTFMSSPEEALRLAEAQPFDVVVSDMRMPVINGAALLERVRDISPSTVRIILSGQSEVSTIMKSVGPSHRFLTKPCDKDSLDRTITTACMLREHMSNPRLAELIGGIKTLPSLPSVYSELISAIRNEAPMREIGQIISSDIGMTTKILQIVNSSYFGVAREVGDPARAAQMLGTETLQALVLGVKIFDEHQRPQIPGGSVEQLGRESSIAAAYARLICIEAGVDEVTMSQAILAAFVHDLGLLILGTHKPELLARAAELEREDDLSQSEAERSTIGATHGDVGACLVGLWGFPDPIVSALAFHHCPSLGPEQGLTPLTIVHVAQSLAHGTGSEGKCEDQSSLARMDREYLAGLGLTNRLEHWIELCLEAEADG